MIKSFLVNVFAVDLIQVTNHFFLVQLKLTPMRLVGIGKFIELTHRNTFIERQVAVDVIYKGNITKGQRLDLLVERQVIVELKFVSLLPDVATAQVLSYLRAT